jgi:hypothetical protein
VQFGWQLFIAKNCHIAMLTSLVSIAGAAGSTDAMAHHHDLLADL